MIGDCNRTVPLDTQKTKHMKDKTLYILLAVATVIMMGMLLVMHLQNDQINQLKDIINNTDTTTTVRTDTVYQTKTVTDTVPKLVTKTIIKHDTLYKDSIPFLISLESKTFENTITEDDDTTVYQAHISGYDVNNNGYPRLDSIKLNTSHKTITVYQETIIERKVPQKTSKWHLSPSVGFGYGLTKKETDIYLGVSFGYNIWNK